MNNFQGDFERLTVSDIDLIAQLLALDPTSTQLIAALHETYRRENGVDTPEHARQLFAIDNPDWPAPTLHERARRIDPGFGGCCNATWGEWISPGHRLVNVATCWYGLSEDDFVPDWQMRDSWPEYADTWEDLYEDAWERHRLARRAAEANDPRFAFDEHDLPF